MVVGAPVAAAEGQEGSGMLAQAGDNVGAQLVRAGPAGAASNEPAGPRL